MVSAHQYPVSADELYRVGYEAIRNACTHSRGSRLEVGLTCVVIGLKYSRLLALVF